MVAPVELGVPPHRRSAFGRQHVVPVGLGSFAERIYGRATFLVIYLVTGVAGAMCSLAWHPFAVEAGASGAIFGIAGALIASFYFGNLPFPRQSIKAALFSVVAFAGYNLFVGMLSSAAGNAAHIGGLVSGLVLGLLLAQFPGRRTVLMGAGLAIVLGCCFSPERMGTWCRQNRAVMR